MKKLFILPLLILFLFPVQQTFGWGQEGHRIIGQIAYNHLSKKAKKQVDKVLGAKGIVYWANWADEIKSDTIYPNSYDWHFQDLEGGMSNEAVVATLSHYPSEGGNLWRVMDSLTVVLRNDPSNFDALRFFVHLAGDCFCPMHTGHMDDYGGNKVKFDWFGQKTNLHRVWDTDLINARGYSYTEYAEYLENRFDNNFQKAVRMMSEEDILLNNYRITNEIYEYQKSWDGNTYHYIYKFADVLELQLYAAGIRLAGLLNEIYG